MVTTETKHETSSVTHLRLDPHTKAVLREWAEQEGVTLSDVLRRAARAMAKLVEPQLKSAAKLRR